MDAFSVFFSQPADVIPPCHPGGNRSLYEGKYDDTRRRVNGSRQDDKAEWREQAAKKMQKSR